MKMTISAFLQTDSYRETTAAQKPDTNPQAPKTLLSRKVVSGVKMWN